LKAKEKHWNWGLCLLRIAKHCRSLFFRVPPISSHHCKEKCSGGAH